MSFQTYEKYKPSGINWLGEIPEGWEVKRLKDVVSIKNGSDYKDIETDSGIPVIGSGGQFRYASKYIYDGESILFGRKGTINKPLYIIGKFWTVDTMFYSILTKKVFGKFLYYFAMRIPFQGYSTQTALPSMTQTVLEGIYLGFPNKQTQTAIADYLDQHTALIDKKIELLKAKKQSYTELKQTLINEVVTKGLDKAVGMKDSGIEWIGQIPKHWEVKRLKEIGRLYNGYGFSLNDQGNDIGEIPFYKVSDINGSQKYISVANNYVSIDLCKKNSWKLIPNMSIITAKIGEALKKNHRKINTKECLIDNNCVAIVINNYDVDYYFWLFKTVDFAYFDNMGTVPSMSTNHFNSFEVVSPPKSEQIAIANHLDEKTSKIDQIIKKIDENILALQEFRKTLINDVVTGKVKVL